MIFDLLKCVASLGVLLLSGGAVYLSVIRRDMCRKVEFVVYGWGAGVVLLYLAGGLFVRSRPLFFRWHLYSLTSMIAVALAIALINRRRIGWFPNRAAGSGPGRIFSDVWAVALLVFICTHTLILLWINLNHPIFDSDATNASRWVGLAKEIFRQGGLEASTHIRRPMFPSLIPLWANIFTTRWFDSLAALPWFVFYCSFLLLSGNFVCRVTGSLRNGLIYSSVLAVTPIIWIHVIRPGFSDLILCYFLGCVLSLLFYSQHYHDRQYFFFSLVFMVGACLTKQEGGVWMIVIYASYALLYAYARHRASLVRIVAVEVVVLGAGVCGYLLTADYLHDLLARRSVYLGMLLYVRHDPRALQMLTERLFTWATFGCYWYLFLGLLAYLLVRARRVLYRLICVQIVLLLGLLVFFFCATGNVQLTISGTNTSRLLMHWVPLGGLLLSMLLQEESAGGAAPQERSSPNRPR